MRLTRAFVEKTVHCGDVACVTYRRPDALARAMRYFERGRSTHSIEGLGGLDTVEETIGGGMRTNLYTYLRGTCDLTIRRARGGLDLHEQKVVRAHWLGLVGKGYGWDSIKRAAVTVPIRQYVKPRYPRAAKLLLGAARLVLRGAMPDCSAAWVEGIRLVRPHVLLGYDASEVDPETILRARELVTVAEWKAPYLEDE